MRTAVRNSLAMASFIVYAIILVVFHQERPSTWSVETGSGIPAAISFFLGRAPLGSVERNILAAFFELKVVTPATVNETIETTAAGTLPRSVSTPAIDGNGIGWPIFASLAMKTFGPHLTSLVPFLLLVMGISTLLYAIRFQDDRLLMVPLIYCALSFLVWTPLGSLVDQFAMGGIRYFSLVGILPGLHIFFELTEAHLESRAQMRNLALLMIQTVLFVLVLLGRINIAYMLCPLLLAISWRLWRTRRSPSQLRILALKVGTTALASIGFLAIVWAINPDYFRNGQTFGTIWHRLLTGITYGPSWPYGNLREVYDCSRAFPGGLGTGGSDQQAHCIWFAWGPNQSRSIREVIDGLFGAEYERAMRAAFFSIVRQYPLEVLDLQLREKPIAVFQTLQASLPPRLNTSRTINALIALQCAAFFAFVLGGLFWRRREIGPSALIIPVIFASSLLPLLMHVSGFVKAGDAILLMYAGLLLGSAFTAHVVIDRLIRASA
jgi:hypothetical protein